MGRPPRQRRWTASTTTLMCPHCGKFHTHEEMWRALVRKYRNTRYISEALQMSGAHVFMNIAKYGLESELDLPPHAREQPDWYEVAERLGFKTPQIMFYRLKHSRGLNYEKMARILNVPDNDDLRKACRAFVSGEVGERYAKGDRL